MQFYNQLKYNDKIYLKSFYFYSWAKDSLGDCTDFTHWGPNLPAPVKILETEIRKAAFMPRFKKLAPTLHSYHWNI